MFPMSYLHGQTCFALKGYRAIQNKKYYLTYNRKNNSFKSINMVQQKFFKHHSDDLEEDLMILMNSDMFLTFPNKLLPLMFLTIPAGIFENEIFLTDTCTTMKPD